jgi:hypothetical protein
MRFTYTPPGRPQLQRQVSRMRRTLIRLGAVALLVASEFSVASPSLNDRKRSIKAMETKNTPEATQRKERTEAVLRSEGVPINKSLPVIEAESEATKRSKDQVAYRALALLIVAVKGEGLEQPIIERLVKEYGVEKHFTPKEIAFIRNPSPSRHDSVQFLWRYEAAWTLLWALGYVEKLEKPTAICDVPRAVKFMKERSAKQFIADAKLRPMSAILDQADKIYRYHWAVVDARINGKNSPANLEPGVTMERHYALNWLIGYMEQDWDDISTDT